MPAAISAAAPTRCAATSAIGRSVKYWTNPIVPWASSTPSNSSASRPSGSLRSSKQSSSRQRDQHVDARGVHVAHHVRVEAVARRIGVARVRAAAGHDGAEVDHDPQDDVHRDDPAGGSAGRVRPRRTPRTAEHEQDRGGDQQHRQDQVQRHDPRVEVGQHADAADDGLERHAEHDDQGEAALLPRRGGPAPDRDVQADDHGDEDVRQHPVAELDDTVAAQLAVRRERLVGALGPRRAAETGAGQAYEAAGQDDHGVGDDGRPRPLLDRAIGPAPEGLLSLPLERP